MANTVNGVYYAKGTNYDNTSSGGGYYDDATVKAAQAYVGASQDGMWGANSSAAAGGKSLDQIVREMNSAQSYGGGSSRKSSNDLSSYLKQQAEAQLESELANLKNAYEKNIAAYDEQAKTLPSQYEEMRNAAAAQEALARRNFNEQAVAGGLNTGVGGQAALSRSSTYQNALAQIDRDEAEALRKIESAKDALTAEYENAMARARAEGDAALANKLYSEMVRVQNMDEGTAVQIAAPTAQTTTSGGGKTSGGGGYNNGGLTSAQVALMQKAYGVTADGKWGAESSGKTRGLTAQEAWNLYIDDQKKNDSRYLDK